VSPHDMPVLKKLSHQMLSSLAGLYYDEKLVRISNTMAGYATVFARNETRKQIEMLSLLRGVMMDHDVTLPTIGKELDALLGDTMYQDWLKES
jgi:hypothetical protein